MENTTTSNINSSGNGFHNSEDLQRKTSEKVSEYFGVASEEFKKLERVIKKNVDKNPILVLGGALAAGYFAGYLMRRLSSSSYHKSNLTH